MKSNRNRCFLIPNWWGGTGCPKPVQLLGMTSETSVAGSTENFGVHGLGLVSYQLTICHLLKCHFKAVNKKDTIASFAKVAPILVYTPIYNRFSQSEISLQLAYKLHMSVQHVSTVALLCL